MKKLVNWLGPAILLGTLLVSVPRYAAAFVQAEPPLFGLPTAPVTGLGFGLLLELGLYYVIDSWFGAKRRGLNLHWLLLLGVGVQLVLGPVIVAPAIVGHLRTSPGELGAVLWWEPALWAWAVVVAAAPALLLAAVAAASYLREPVARKAEDSGAPKRSEPAKSVIACDLCGATSGKDGKPFRSSAAIAGHKRWEHRVNGKEPATQSEIERS
jgi:hypothetical protein